MSGRKESVASLGSLGSSEDSYSDAESEGGARSSWGEQESSCQEIYDICGYIGPSICSDSPDTSLSCLETMSVSRALDVLNMKPTTHNLDSKDLAHHVNKMIQEIEQKRVECNRLMRNRNKRRISKFLKTPEMLEQEAQQAKWKSSKVREELCLVQEAYQFLISKYKAKQEPSTATVKN